MPNSGNARKQQRQKIEQIARTLAECGFVAQHRLDDYPRDAQDLRVIGHDDQPDAGHRPLAAKGTCEALGIYRGEDVRGVRGPETPPKGFREQNFSCAYVFGRTEPGRASQLRAVRC